MEENDFIHNWLYPDWPAPANIHAVTTTRIGGVSQGAFDSMNLADHVEDDPEAVQTNRDRLKEKLGLQAEPFWLSQEHGTQVINAMDANPGTKADGAYSSQSGDVCAVLTADCLPVLLCNQAGTRVAAVHAGWRGLLAGVIETALDNMKVSGSEVLAWLGPAIGPDAFEVGSEIRSQFVARHPQATDAFQQNPHKQDKWLADIIQLARLRLSLKGVSQVYGGNWCTFADKNRFYSYRRDGVTGRMASLIWMET